MLVNVTGTANSCLPADTMYAGMTAGCGVVGIDPSAQYCKGSQLASASYTEGEGILLSSNDQAAAIPLCGIGDVTLIVKNVTVDVDLYDFFLQQTLTDVTYVPGSALISVVNSGVVITAPTPFTPTSIAPMTPTIPTSNTQVLIWDSQAMTDYPPSLLSVLTDRDGRDEIVLTFQVRTYSRSPRRQSKRTAAPSTPAAG